jgi:hypothetical protein
MEKCTLTSFVAFWVRSEGNAPKKWESRVGFTFTTILHHTGGFRSRASYQKNNVTTLEHPPFSLEQAAADCNLYHRLKSALKGRRFFDATEIIKDATVRAENAFTKWFPGIFPTLLQSLAEVYNCTRRLF